MKYIIIFAKDEVNHDIKYRFMLSTKKKLVGDVAKELLQALVQTEGIDRFEPVGNYTVDVSIGRAFDADEVLKNLTEKLDTVLSDIIQVSKDIKV